jgi:signal peptidase II|tara:strand:- start:835 stop:1332 length:498 start_codon:yes stop_codon:yes gene_type:complete
MNIHRKYFYLFILFFAATDQLSKYYLIRHFDINPELLISDFLYKVNEYFNIVIVWNRGFAFGSFQSNMLSFNILYVCIISSVICILLIYANKLNQKYYFFAFSLVIGGALGNLIDRIAYGAVIDFIDLNFQNLHWYVFNIADIYISLGCILLIFAEIRNKLTDND